MAKTEKNPKGAGAKPKGDKPKVQYGGGRIDANLAEKWKEVTGNSVVHLEKAMRQYLESLLLPDELYPSVFDDV